MTDEPIHVGWSFSFRTVGGEKLAVVEHSSGFALALPQVPPGMKPDQVLLLSRQAAELFQRNCQISNAHDEAPRTLN